MGTTEVPCTPERVVTLGQGERGAAFALDVTPIATVEAWTDEWYEYLPDEIQSVEVIGTELEPDLEKIASLAPDVILGSKLRHEEVYDEPSQIAPTVFTETIGETWKETSVSTPRRCATRSEVMRCWTSGTSGTSGQPTSRRPPSPRNWMSQACSAIPRRSRCR